MRANTHNITNINTDINFGVNQIKKKLQYPRLKLKDKGKIFEMKNDKIGILSNVLKIYEIRSYIKIQEIIIKRKNFIIR